MTGTLAIPARHRQGVARCSAVTGRRVTDYGFEPLRCHQTHGIRFLVAADGSRHAYCARHRLQVAGQVARSVG